MQVRNRDLCDCAVPRCRLCTCCMTKWHQGGLSISLGILRLHRCHSLAKVKSTLAVHISGCSMHKHEWIVAVTGPAESLHQALDAVEVR